MKYVLLLLLGVILSLFLFTCTFAHSGRTNSAGCHNDYINGGYHCHNGGYSVPTYTPPKVYFWDKIYYDYSEYYKARWDGIQEMYREYLGRGFYTQEEGKLYVDSDKNKLEIMDAIMTSAEAQAYKAKQESKQVADTPVAKTDQVKDTDYTWIYWILGIGAIWTIAYYSSK